MYIFPVLENYSVDKFTKITMAFNIYVIINRDESENHAENFKLVFFCLRLLENFK